jgi:hypothetical protein
MSTLREENVTIKKGLNHRRENYKRKIPDTNKEPQVNPVQMRKILTKCH